MPPAAVFGDLLRPAELRFLTASGARSPDALYAVLATDRSLRRGGGNASQGIRRRLLMRLLRPLVCAGFRGRLRQADWRRSPMRGGASPPASRSAKRTGSIAREGGIVWFDLKVDLRYDSGDYDLGAGPVLTGRAGRPPVEAPFSRDEARRWIPTHQLGQNTCAAHAAAACIEVMRARAGLSMVPPSVRFLYNRMSTHSPKRPPPGPGFSTLGQAKDAITLDGICSSSTWPNGGPLEQRPSDAAVQEGHANRFQISECPDFDGPVRPTGVARLIHGELVAGRPVAIAMPAFRDPAHPQNTDTWFGSTVKTTGIVYDWTGWEEIEASGHAVCVVGFQPGGDSTAGGGWFVFRNSFGLGFAQDAKSLPETAPPPRVPAPGYGAISARNVDAHVWELLSFKRPGE